MDKMQLKALAKINLGLDVLRKREDGYHDVRMIMQTVRIFDRLALVKQDKEGIRVRTNLYYLPANENNLVYKAANLLFEEFDIPGGLSIDLKKYIPVAAGMAGGSSDAAAVLYGLNRMYGLGLSQEQLMERGVIEIAPLAYMRGRTLSDAFVVLDEAQNTTPEQMKMFLTRLGFNSKFVITGDLSQRDLVGRRGGLADVERILGRVDDVAFSHLERADVVRHALVGRIVEAYDTYDDAHEQRARDRKESR